MARRATPVLGPGLGLALALAGTACADSAPSPSETTAVDSAGVRLVTWPAGPRDTIRVSDEVLTIGAEGDTLYQFTRVSAVEALSDGRIVVGDGGVNEVRYYGPDGTWQATVGGRGEGPSEIGFLSSAQRWKGDTLVVLDPRNRRFALFSPEPAFARTARWPEGTSPMPEGAGACIGPTALGLVAGPRMAHQGWACVFREGSEGVRAFEMTIRMRDFEGTAHGEPIGSIAVTRVFERMTDDPRLAFPPVPLANPIGFDVSEEGLFVTHLEAYRIDHYDPDGRLRLRIRDAMPRRAVTAAMEAEHLENLPDALRPGVEQVPMPDSLPGFDRLIATEEGPWARHRGIPSDSLVVWSAYSSDGAEARLYAFPGNFDLRSVVDGLAYGTITDELDVQRIRVYRLPGGG